MNEKFYLIATFNSLKTEKAKRYHFELIRWCSAFRALGAEIIVMTRDSQSYLNEIKELYKAPIRYIEGEGTPLFNGDVKDVDIYVKKRNCVKSYMMVFDCGGLVSIIKRINEENIMKLAESMQMYEKRKIKKFLKKC